MIKILRDRFFNTISIIITASILIFLNYYWKTTNDFSKKINYQKSRLLWLLDHQYFPTSNHVFFDMGTNNGDSILEFFEFNNSGL